MSNTTIGLVDPKLEDTSVAAFISSLTLNGSVAVICLIAFSVVRKKFPTVYDPRRRLLGVDPNVLAATPPLTESLFGWIFQVLRMEDSVMLESVGLDGVMYIKFLETATKFFCAACVVGLGILMPINFSADPPEDKKQQGLDKASMANVDPNQKNLLWAHTLAVWFFTLLLFYFLNKMYKFYYAQRIKFLVARRPEWYSVLVQDVPENKRDAASLEAFFRKRYGDEVYSVMMAHETTALDKLVKEREEVVRKLENAHFTHLKKEERPQHRQMGGILGKICCCCGSKVDSIDYYTEELERLNAEILEEQAAEHKVTPSGFVSFRSLSAAVSAVQTLQTEDPMHWTLERAPAPIDVYWPSLGMDGRKRKAQGLIISVLVFFLVVFWAIPVSALAVMANFNKLAETFPVLEPVITFSPALIGFVQALVPTILLLVFMSLLPKILLTFGKKEGIASNAELQKSVMIRFFTFQLFNVLLVVTLAGSFLGVASELAEGPFTVISLLGSSIPAVANFYVAYVLLQALSGFPLELLRPVPLILGELKRRRALTAYQERSAWHPGELFYGGEIAKHLVVFYIGIIFSFIAPVVLPVTALYFGLGLLVRRHHVAYVYVAPFEAGGSFWPRMFNRILAGAVMSQLTAMGILSIKESPLGSLIIPLPIMTLIFARYARRAYETPTQFAPLGITADVDNGIDAVSESTGLVVATPDRTKDLLDFTFLDNQYVQPSVNAPPVPPSIIGDEAAVDELLKPHFGCRTAAKAALAQAMAQAALRPMLARHLVPPVRATRTTSLSTGRRRWSLQSRRARASRSRPRRRLRWRREQRLLERDLAAKDGVGDLGISLGGK
ncbi:early responsive to dehydration protein [Thecamonas trahens ATCC 50062]|uniref:Early responsive to dehydration protein n=1 Tax=Thecamonas trahens ATCC 50062 TaxID=461836 RepID=A0A0L0DNP2_THETB|nr:early responsive to dehydration protein [Thecamonas trahens ATCC 50062]KNC53885.1 early responsive to dehydration protein [Thecamonas trahens ATCC 50062]|eukprot:XP_013754261.1 early responsive to dehydration protein [Thecamonas trahens ATCC 50062]